MQINKFITLSRNVVQPTAPVWRYSEVANKPNLQAALV